MLWPYPGPMRNEWVSVSASALVTGAMALLLGSLLNPITGEQGAGQTLSAVTENSGRWMAVAVLYLIASVALTLGLPTILALFPPRTRGFGTVAVAVFAVGTIGTAGYAMLMVFFRALVDEEVIRSAGGLQEVTGDSGFLAFLYGWIGFFYVGLLLVAFALFAAKRTRVWVPALLVVFVAMFPVASQLGRVGTALQLMVLAVAFTGIAVAATSANEQLEDAAETMV